MQDNLSSRIYDATALFQIFFNSSFIILNLLFIPPALSQDASISTTLTNAGAGLDRFLLDNGMVVLLKENHAAPLVSLQVWIGTGSAGEEEYLGGGLSHWMEHMIFKGTPLRPPGQIARTINDAGGAIRAYTGNDRTVFLTDMPSRHWQTGLEVLADALQNAAFPEEEWQREKDVILREMAMDKDSPDRRLSRLLEETAYRVHPYRVPTIGYPDVFQTLTRQDLLAFYRRHYVPNNMILVLTGDVDAEAAQSAIRAAFGKWPRRAHAPAIMPPEPDQVGARFARQTGPYAVTRVAVCWPAVAMTHPDAPDLDMLAAITGSGRSSRLARELKESGKLATEISAWSYTPREPGLFGISAVCAPGNESALIAAIQTEVARWTTEPFHRKEIEKARRMMLTGTLATLQTTHGQADQFASSEFYAGAPLYFQTYLQRLERVSEKSLLATARKYLRTDKRTIAVLAPEPKSREPAGRQAPAGAGKVEKSTLPNGIPLLIREDHKLPMIWLCAVSGGGLLLENEKNNGITSMMAELLIRGTRQRSAGDIARTVESLGASLTTYAGYNSCGLRAEGLSRDADALIELLADCLRSPVFSSDELEKRKAVQTAIIQQQRESPMFIAQQAMRQALFPGHPYRFVPDGAPETIALINNEQVRAWHAKTMVAGNTVLAIFGDISPDQARAMAEKYFKRFPLGTRTADDEYLLRPSPSPSPFSSPARGEDIGQWRRATYPKPALPQRVQRTEPREQAVILAGFPGVDLMDKRNDALTILQQALSGLSSELMISIRDKQGLAYYAGAIYQPGVMPGFFALYAGTRPSALGQVEALIRQEIQRITTQGLRQEELDRARNKLITDYYSHLQLNSELAFECALNELYGRGYAYSLEMEKRLRSVTREAVKDAAASILNTNNVVISIVEPELGELKIKNEELKNNNITEVDSNAE